MAKSKKRKKILIEKLQVKKSKLLKLGYRYEANQVGFEIKQLKEEI